MSLIAVDSSRVRVNGCLDSAGECLCTEICFLTCRGEPGGGRSKYTSEEALSGEGGEGEGLHLWEMGWVLPN